MCKCKHYPYAVVVGQISEGYIQSVPVQSKSFFQVSHVCGEIFISSVFSLRTESAQTRVKKGFNYAIGLVKKSIQTR